MDIVFFPGEHTGKATSLHARVVSGADNVSVHMFPVCLLSSALSLSFCVYSEFSLVYGFFKNYFVIVFRLALQNVPQFDASTSVVVYPTDDALRCDQLSAEQLRKLKHVIVLDAQWHSVRAYSRCDVYHSPTTRVVLTSQVARMDAHASLRDVPRVKLHR